MKVIVFGAGHFGRLYAEQEKTAEIIAYADNDAESRRARGGVTSFLGHKLISPYEISQYEYDRIVICVDDDTSTAIRLEGAQAMDSIFGQLLSLGIDQRKIAVHNVLYFNSRRTLDLKRLSECLENVDGAVAECGVLRGHFAAYINRYFQNRRLYLFDTFTGFDERDTVNESDAIKKWLDVYGGFYLPGNTDIVSARCPFPENLVFKKGYVPDTFAGLENERFAFVNLDMDLYLPELNALRFFVPRLSKGGVILLHDYFNPSLHGVKQAVDEFSSEYDFVRIPTGDEFTIALTAFNKRKG
jgi:hypothetical protein